MSEEINVSVNLTTEVCCACGVVFTLPCTLRETLLENHKGFYCPNGHGIHFVGKTKDEEIGDLESESMELSQEIQRLEKRVEYYKTKANKVKK